MLMVTVAEVDHLADLESDRRQRNLDETTQPVKKVAAPLAGKYQKSGPAAGVALSSLSLRSPMGCMKWVPQIRQKPVRAIGPMVSCRIESLVLIAMSYVAVV
mmetsp:Transcript_99907/g.192938  ORF Transcript_99907/g.192938 Transcript_99907/m.192938 type:complete len:102 (-) Transcript_99907:279-584(-)